MKISTTPNTRFVIEDVASRATGVQENIYQNILEAHRNAVAGNIGFEELIADYNVTDLLALVAQHTIDNDNNVIFIEFVGRVLDRIKRTGF